VDIGLEKTMMAAPGAIPVPPRSGPESAPSKSTTLGGPRVQLKPNPFADQPARAPSFPQKIPKLEIKTPDRSPGKSLELEPELQGAGSPGFEVERSLITMAGSSENLDPSYYGGASSEGGVSGLDIASIAPPAPSQIEEPETPKKQEQDDFQVRELAGFGIPQSGVVGALKYWLKVRKRLDALAGEYDQAVDRCRSVLEKKRESCAELGRQAGIIGFDDDSVAPFISKAVAAQDELSGRERQRLNSASEDKAKIEPIDVKIKFVESEAAPFYEQEKQALEEQRKVVAARKRIEVKKSDAEKEIKTIDEQIEKLQLEFSDLTRPKEERDRLLKEIALIDRKRHPFLKQADEFEKELSVLDGPLEKVDSKLKEVRGFLNAKLDEIRGLTAEKNKLLREFNKRENDAQRQLEEEASKVDLAWAAVGEKIVETRCREHRLEKLQSKALASISDADQAENKVALISKARDSYDKETVERAKRAATIIAAVVGGLIILLLILGKM
jgi:hypothetical protein